MPFWRVLFFTAAELVSKSGGAKAVHPGLIPGPTGSDGAPDLRRAGLRQAQVGAASSSCSWCSSTATSAPMLVTSNLPFSEWNQIFQGERIYRVPLDRRHPIARSSR